MPNKPVVLIILDGWGHREEVRDNAIAQAKTPFYDSLLVKYPHALLDASQESVGLPEGQMGNSEIGHMTIGAGSVIDTDLVKIAKAIRNNEFGQNRAFLELFDHVKEHDSALHVMGLVSHGGVHSHESHLHAFLRAAKDAGIKKIYIHAFTDGRDTPPQSASNSLKALEELISDLGIGHIATASGRFYAMDRDKNWDRLEKFEKLLFGQSPESKDVKVVADKKPSDAYCDLYAGGVIDEHAEPMVFLDESGSMCGVREHDGIFFFNFRADRARQLSAKVAERSQALDLFFVTMTEYDDAIPAVVAFPKSKVATTLASEISKAGLRQAHIAETEKYAHVTFFLNGGRNEPHENEEHILIESRKDVQTHDLAPKMRAEQIADKAIEQLDSGTDFIVMNFANADMVGHTASVPALVEAVEEVDLQLKRVVEKALEHGGVVMVTADHGNAELNIDPETGEKHTAHTTNLVPVILTLPGVELRGGTLADIAPTILELVGLPRPNGMTGVSIIKR
jgi:2,3-bisphosphoglycerate-independent phosphoglycerate mutase